METTPGRPEPPPGTPSPFRFLGVGVELIAPILVGLWLGWKADAWLGTGPWLLLGGTVLGMAAGFVSFYRRVLPPRGGAPPPGTS